MNEEGFLEIDGSVLEGGGQILRISISLSAIMGIPIKVSNIRAGRKKPGLAAQHLTGIKLLGDMCGAKLKGLNIGSTEIEFVPGKKIHGGHYVADTRTAGSISLLLQVALPCALFADGPVTLDLKGGTNADMAPQIDFMTEVFAVYLKKFGAKFDLTIHRRGYFPKGGGLVTVEVQPVSSLTAVELLQRGTVSSIRAWSFVAGVLPIRMAQQMADGFKEQIRELGAPIDIDVYKEDARLAPDNCSGIMAVCELSSGLKLCADTLGRRGTDAEVLGRDTAEVLKGEVRSEAAVDTHIQDQLILYMGLAEGKSSMKAGPITLHTKTAIHIVELIAKTKFTIKEDGDNNIIECTGLRFVNKYMNVR